MTNETAVFQCLPLNSNAHTVEPPTASITRNPRSCPWMTASLAHTISAYWELELYQWYSQCTLLPLTHQLPLSHLCHSRRATPCQHCAHGYNCLRQQTPPVSCSGSSRVPRHYAQNSLGQLQLKVKQTHFTSSLHNPLTSQTSGLTRGT